MEGGAVVVGFARVTARYLGVCWVRSSSTVQVQGGRGGEDKTGPTVKGYLVAAGSANGQAAWRERRR